MSLQLPEEILAMLLSKMKRNAEVYLCRSVNNAVVAVPGYFGYAQCQAMKDVGTIAGLNILRMAAEPTLAVLGHYAGLGNLSAGEHFTLALDVGSGELTQPSCVLRMESSKSWL
jgi:molecular chaperone DnaK (HSP70)